MKGVILAGGMGTRLFPLTKITNKHLLPIYDRPMIHYPLKTLSDAGLRDILVVTGGNHAGEFLRLLGNGREYGLNEIAYAYQEGEGGIADALALARPFAKGDRIVVMLGDNVIEGDIRRQVAAFAAQPRGEGGHLAADVPLDDVVAQHHDDAVALGERSRQRQSVGDPALAFLVRIGDFVEPVLPAVAEEPEELAGVIAAGDDEDVAQAGVREGLQRIVDHRPVVDRQQVLVGDLGEWEQPRSHPPGEDDALHILAAPVVPATLAESPGGVKRRAASAPPRGALSAAPAEQPSCGGTQAEEDGARRGLGAARRAEPAPQLRHGPQVGAPHLLEER